MISKQGDIRDKFLFDLPLLAPRGFKPLEEHLDKCKICYENQINTLFMPCRHELFCHSCTKLLKIQTKGDFVPAQSGDF